MVDPPPTKTLPQKFGGSPRKLGGPDPPTPPVVAPLSLTVDENDFDCLREIKR